MAENETKQDSQVLLYEICKVVVNKYTTGNPSPKTYNFDDKTSATKLQEIISEIKGLGNTDPLNEEEIKTLNEKIKEYNQKNGSNLSTLPAGASLTAVAEMAEKIKLPASDDNGTIVVGGEEKNRNNDRAWLANKVAIWKELAQEKQLQLEHTDGDDKFSLLKGNERLGTVRYTSESNAEVSPDAKLEMYLGLVKDAAKSGKTITLGDKLTDAQKAMLLAATLMSTDSYKDGEKVKLINPPQIDTNAEYFKTLPDDVKKELSAYADRQAKIEKLRNARTQLDQAQSKLKGIFKDYKKGQDISDKQKKDRKNVLSNEIHNANDLLSAETVITEKDRSGKQKSQQGQQAEKILAARLGIAPKTTYTSTKDKIVKDGEQEHTVRKGEQVTVEKDEAFAKRFKEKNPLLYAAMLKKYGNQNN